MCSYLCVTVSTNKALKIYKSQLDFIIRNILDSPTTNKQNRAEMTLKHPVRYIGKAGYEFLLSLFMSLVLKSIEKATVSVR